MTKNTHTAKLPDGTIAERTSSSGRAYLFCVATLPSYELALKRASKPSETDASNYNYHLKVIAEKGTTYQTKWSGQTDEAFAAQCAKRVADYTAANMGATSAAEYVAIKVAERIAHIEELKANGHFKKWIVQGWQSRADLAQKELDKALKSEWLIAADAKIIPVTMVTK